jgi:uncharacterized protein
MQRTNESNWTLSPMDWVFLVLMIIGGLNWGLIGLFNFDLIATVFGGMTFISRIIYTIVGFSAIWSIFELVRNVHKNTFAAQVKSAIATH